jgi:integrase
MGLQKFLEPAERRQTITQLLDAQGRDLQIRGKMRSEISSQQKQLRAFFGEMSAIAVTKDDVDRYILDRQAQGKAPDTINNELDLFERAFKLSNLACPKIRYQEGRVREGFFEKAEIEALIKELPGELQDFTRFGYLTGWRRGEIVSLRWADLDMESGTMSLRREESKNREPRLIPLQGELGEIFNRRWQARIVTKTTGETQIAEHVFHRNGKAITDWFFYSNWDTACEKSGVGRIFHDLRRTAARNMRRAGVSEEVAMKITGHKTSLMFQRYNITDDRDIQEALAKTQAYVSSLPTQQKVIQFPAKVAERG